MVKKRIAMMAAGVTAGIFSPPTTREHRLLPVVKTTAGYFVLVAGGSITDGFLIIPKTRATTALTQLMRGSKVTPGPMPLFNETTNVIVDSRTHRRTHSFKESSIDYDVVLFTLCSAFGDVGEDQQIAQLEKHEFTLLPLDEHRLGADIKGVLHIA